ncbi:hypothetical protein AMTR_s00175p00026100 [Amborella trichopoda]|uniref:Uncharacterized protein n=1 Tax=Amborella trichopoda TaxID=13333 RepID=U5D0J7_AMBTC|nr:hypothetical protein AMTR_s00175p00026100 [Amborella trichopoda]
MTLASAIVAWYRGYLKTQGLGPGERYSPTCLTFVFPLLGYRPLPRTCFCTCHNVDPLKNEIIEFLKVTAPSKLSKAIPCVDNLLGQRIQMSPPFLLLKFCKTFGGLSSLSGP